MRSFLKVALGAMMANLGLDIPPVPLLRQSANPYGRDMSLGLFLPPPADPSGGGFGTPPVRMSRHVLYRQFAKRLLDLVFVLLTLPVFLPVIGICALALWIEGGSPFYRQDRLGRNGRVFSILKLRTMVRDADAMLEHCLSEDAALAAEWRSTQKLKNDPRVTRVGALLRETSLDELPQLWNVLTGDMSLVGPRPMMPDQLPLYGEPGCYFAVRPGLTGIWQVSLRNETQFSDRAQLDAVYCANLSLWGDFKLLLRTVGVVLRRTGY